MRQSQGPFGNEPMETESRRLTPSIGLTHDSEQPTDSSNEDFLFHLYRGSELLQDNRVHEAKEELERALHLQPRDSKGQDLLAVVYFRLGLYPRAIQIYEQLRRRNTSDTALLLNLALCYLKTGQPVLAKRELEQLVSLNPGHSRAWGYLGLACERLGELGRAEHAFRQGGHTQMAKRIAAMREVAGLPAAEESQPSREVRDVAGAAYQELDAGELSFALAEPVSERGSDEVAASWRPLELGQAATNSSPLRRSERPPQRAETRKPDTRDGHRQRGEGEASASPAMPSVPQLGHHHQSPAANRRPTLIAPVGAPPAYEAGELIAIDRIPSHQPPSFTLDDAAAPVPSVRRPVVSVPSPFGPPKAHQAFERDLARTGTLPPPPGPGSAPPQANSEPPSLRHPPVQAAPAPRPAVAPSVQAHASPVVTLMAEQREGDVVSARRPPVAEIRVGAPLEFPAGGVVLHPSGVALVQTTAEVGFAARLESIRTQQSGMGLTLLERQTKGKPTGESFGGVSSPMVLATAAGQLVLAPRAGRKLWAFNVAGEMAFAREDVIVGFGGGLAFENGRLGTGEGEFIPVVQLRGDGGLLFEAMGEVLVLPVHSERSVSVRRESILGWFGRLVPRAVSPNDAPCGQRGLVSFAGEGRVLVASS